MGRTTGALMRKEVGLNCRGGKWKFLGGVKGYSGVRERKDWVKLFFLSFLTKLFGSGVKY